MNEMTIAAKVENIPAVTAFVDERLEALDCPLKAQMQIDIAIDELFGNIAHYAPLPPPRGALRSPGQGGPGRHVVRRGAGDRRPGNLHGEEDHGRDLL